MLAHAQSLLLSLQGKHVRRGRAEAWQKGLGQKGVPFRIIKGNEQHSNQCCAANNLRLTMATAQSIVQAERYARSDH